jgi:DUF4097 and DUF4098 domain-containing protein YvlB
MNVNNSDYYATVINSRNELVIESGRRSYGMFNRFNCRVDVYIPESNKNFYIKTSSGDIAAAEEYVAASITIESSSGNIKVASITTGMANFVSSSGDITASIITADMANFTTSSGDIRCKRINGNADIETKSGRIVFGSIGGNVSAESSSGDIELDLANGTVNVKSSSGGVRCTATENAGDISITTSSGDVALNIPKNFAFDFVSRSSSGSLRTPFPEKLFIPVSDKGSTQGTVGNANIAEGQSLKKVNIRTSSGSIRVAWAD